jgi:hypothetical protein
LNSPFVGVSADKEGKYNNKIINRTEERKKRKKPINLNGQKDVFER